MTRRSPLPVLLLLMLLGAAQAAPRRDWQPHASPGDTLSLLKTFIAVCQSYQHLPLQLDLEMQHSTNLMTSPDDTLSQSAGFYLSSRGSCVRFGELEQLSTDSLASDHWAVSHRSEAHHRLSPEHRLCRKPVGALRGPATERFLAGAIAAALRGNDARQPG